ncbi:hypothetical protein AB835_01535 [Candidatus Endobugula sertula]|uniref:Uncharacterized protein n=1 Tax=Candidatus Endobugula sertula TaxID=62101 RepID=A0A1D2QT77_9GAMM|nr:hypothetical protein AB835_01535 [Candidatus Endobugula sertula]
MAYHKLLILIDLLVFLSGLAESIKTHKCIKTRQNLSKPIQKRGNWTLFCKAREMLRALKDFQESATGYVISTVAAATTIASLTFSDAAQAENPVTAQPVAATQSLNAGERGLDAVQGRHDMEDYSNDTSIRGIGIFINLQGNASFTEGQALGDKLKNAFASRGVPVEYRINHSRGTATDLTFYVKGVDYKVNVANIQRDLGTILAKHNGAWLVENASLDSTIAPEQT